MNPSLQHHRLSLARIEQAARLIDPVFLDSPQYECEPLSHVLGCRLTLKLETANPIRSFKGRGADCFVKTDERVRPGVTLVCATAGNWGQALAWVCRARGLRLVVYTATTANPLKLQRMREMGAEVRLHSDDFDAAKAEAKRYAQADGGLFVEDGREASIAEGAGTIGLELLARGESFNALVLPLGNGALLTGVARWVKAHSPGTQVVGVGARGADAMERSWREGRIVERDAVDTIADGIAVRVPVPEAVHDMQGLVDDVVLVDDGTVVEAMRTLFRHAGVLVEPAGAVGVATLLAGRARWQGARVATVLCGSNLTAEQIERWLR
nr:pyridoxal-phosphate dependent enzyme [uncultured Caldimonas sp.]